MYNVIVFMDSVAETSQLINTKKAKKISIASAINVVVGSTIGAGIFFKNKSIWVNSNYKDFSSTLTIAIFCWVIAGISVICLALSLLEVMSAQKGNKSLVGWSSTFNKKFTSSWSRWYMLVVYYPINYLAMPVYVVQQISDTSGFNFEWWQILLLAFAIYAFLQTISYYSTKAGNSLQIVLGFVKFLPIVIVPIFGFISASSAATTVANISSPKGFIGLTPFISLFISIPAIFFAFDGFYTVSAIREKLVEPKKLGRAILIGIVIVLSVYMIISIAMFSGTELSGEGAGTIAGFKNPLPKWLEISINTFIVFAILGIANGFALGTHNIYDEYLKDSYGKFAKLLKRKNKLNLSPGVIAVFAQVLIYYLFFGILGSLAYKVAYSPTNEYDYGTREATSLYSMVDLMTNWTSLFIFLIISFVLFGAIRNRKQNFVQVEKQKGFIWLATIGISITFISTIIFVLNTLVNMSGYNGADKGEAVSEFISMILVILIPLLFVGIEHFGSKRSSSINTRPLV